MSRNHTTSFGRFAVALLIAMLGSVIIWVAVPYNNFLLDNTYLSDSYLPEAVIAILLILLLWVNPLLRVLGPRFRLDRWQIAFIGSLLLFAAIVPSNGLMRMFPKFVAQTNNGFNESTLSSGIAAKAQLPQALYPDPLPKFVEKDGKLTDKVQIFDTPISDEFLDELDEKNLVKREQWSWWLQPAMNAYYDLTEVPWSAWAVPMAAWGMLIVAAWAMMLGLGGIVYPQWRDRERLPFPLLNVYLSFTGDDEAKPRTLPAVFRSRGFWIACGIVFFIHAMRGVNTFTNAVPSFPLDWDLTSYLSDTVFRDTTVALKRQWVFFSLVGVAYFIPNRYAMSVWGWVIGYSLYVTFGRAYIPAFNDGQSNDQGFGVIVAIIVWTIWLGRAHWAHVGKAMLGRASGGPESRRDAIAGWMFALGSGGMICWLTWAGCAIWWSILATGVSACVGLVMARIIAETGIPYLWMSRFTVAGVAGLLPQSWLSPQMFLFTGVLYAIVTRASAVSATVMTTLAMGMDAQATAKQHSRVLLGGFAVLVVGFVICGAIHLNMGYHHVDLKTDAKTDAKAIDNFEGAQRSTYTFFNAERGHQAFGLSVGTGLLWACSRFPAWPIHPVGILFVQSSIGHLIWFSIFLGWLIKVTTTNLFGGGAYRKARPIFLGLIFGELMAVIVWAIVPAVIVSVTGEDPSQVQRYRVIQYN